jgi:hypothetical protein
MAMLPEVYSNWGGEVTMLEWRAGRDPYMFRKREGGMQHPGTRK